MSLLLKFSTFLAPQHRAWHITGGEERSVKYVDGCLILSPGILELPPPIMFPGPTAAQGLSVTAASITLIPSLTFFTETHSYTPADWHGSGVTVSMAASPWACV